mmetsp:Transcript_3707/g.2765  ORF Transcript_3707/g.2765 Transcript_3707/m.2765 type:complete len:84 (+) Transcript_3707:177-428(+)
MTGRSLQKEHELKNQRSQHANFTLLVKKAEDQNQKQIQNSKSAGKQDFDDDERIIGHSGSKANESRKKEEPKFKLVKHVTTPD